MPRQAAWKQEGRGIALGSARSHSTLQRRNRERLELKGVRDQVAPQPGKVELKEDMSSNATLKSRLGLSAMAASGPEERWTFPSEGAVCWRVLNHSCRYFWLKMKCHRFRLDDTKDS